MSYDSIVTCVSLVAKNSVYIIDKTTFSADKSQYIVLLSLLSYAASQTKAYQKEWRNIFDPIRKPLRVPNATVVQQKPVHHLYGCHQTEVGIQYGQVQDEDVRGRCIHFFSSYLPDDQDIRRCPHCQVEHFNTKVEDEAIRCHYTYWELVP